MVSSSTQARQGPINYLAKKIRNLVTFVENIPGKRIELFAVLLYAAAHLLMAIFHEPWYDEAVSWQIARCASVRDILFRIPHYEGHPPLWHLILLPFAKLGAPYELSLTLVSLVFAGAAVGLIIYHAPFPRIVRLLLPFTYFFFYQYGVISRPYCVMMLAFILLAMGYRSRNEKPGKYTLSLMLLCLTSAYGILFAGGLAMVWVWEIWNRRNILSFFRSIFTDRRIWWLAALLALALLLIAEIMPREDTFATNFIANIEDANHPLLCLAYTFLVLPMDVFITTVYTDYGLLQFIDLNMEGMLAACCLGLLLWAVCLFWGRSKKTTGILIVPYILFAVFAAIVYSYAHHIGIGLLFLVFWMWATCESEETGKKPVLSENDRTMMRNFLTIFCAVSVAVSLSWTVLACISDIFTVYAAGRTEAAFIKEHGLDQYQIMAAWDVKYDEEENITGSDINHCHNADNIAPYFEHNLFFNFNDGSDDLNYTTHRRPNETETAERIAKWREITPDVLLMEPALEMVYDPQTLSMDDYVLVYSSISNRTWKGITDYGRAELYVRNDLASELGLEPVEDAYPYLWYLFGIVK